MKRLEISPLAERDLNGILDFIARDKPDAAVRFVARLRAACERLRHFPELGELRSEIKPGLCMFCLGNYIVYYNLDTTGIRVERVLHAAQDDDAFYR